LPASTAVYIQLKPAAQSLVLVHYQYWYVMHFIMDGNARGIAGAETKVSRRPPHFLKVIVNNRLDFNLLPFSTIDSAEMRAALSAIAITADSFAVMD